MIKITPHISEKSSNLVKANQYVFLVAKAINKKVLADLVEKQYHVEVIKTQSLNVKGKTKFFRRHKGQRQDYKKIIITLKKGQTIKDFQIETAEKEADKEKEKKTGETNEAKK